jgi:hypothetical protein
MRRTDVRKLNRNVRTANDVTAMQALLARSVKFGHRKLALLRCIRLEKMGVCVDQETLQYCRGIADRMPREVLEQIVAKAFAPSA